ESSRAASRSTPPVSTEIVIDHNASAQHTVIEVLTADRPALLFTLAQALQELGITINVAKINTEGSRVIDVFYVSEADGQKLTVPLGFITIASSDDDTGSSTSTSAASPRSVDPAPAR